MGYQPSLFDLYQFEYTTVQRIRDEGVAADATFTDAYVRKLIRRFSKLVNRVTDQWFWPLENRVRLNGPVGHVISSPDLVPILELRSMAYEGATASPVSASAYRVGDREVYLNGSSESSYMGFVTNSRTKFPSKSNLNILLDGTWGWQENRPFVDFDAVQKVSTTTTVALANAATSIVVTSATGFNERSVVIFRSSSTAGSGYAGHAILTGVNLITNTLSFEALNLNTATLDAGATVITYGAVPEPIEDATTRLVIKYRYKIASAAGQQASQSDQIMKERTDNYAYEYFPDTAQAAASSQSTGDVDADRLLRDYCRPNFVGGV